MVFIGFSTVAYYAYMGQQMNWQVLGGYLNMRSLQNIEQGIRGKITAVAMNKVCTEHVHCWIVQLYWEGAVISLLWARSGC